MNKNRNCVQSIQIKIYTCETDGAGAPGSRFYFTIPLTTQKIGSTAINELNCQAKLSKYTISKTRKYFAGHFSTAGEMLFISKWKCFCSIQYIMLLEMIRSLPGICTFLCFISHIHALLYYATLCEIYVVLSIGFIYLQRVIIFGFFNYHWPLLLTWFNFNPSMDK